MNETLRKLLARLGVTVPENADITDEQATAALTALDTLESNAGKVAALSAKLEKAQKLILELLTKRKVMCLEELEAELLAYGISSRTGRDARKQLESRLSYDWCQRRKTVALITE